MKLKGDIRSFMNIKKINFEINLYNRKLLFLSIIMIFSLFSTSSIAGWFDNFNYRRALTVTNSGAATLTNYQVKITLTSSNFNNHFPQANGEDIRITAADGTTILPFWIEKWSANQGVIWTKIPNIPVGSSTIYIYYGNNLVTSASSGKNTFSLFEDNWVVNPVQVSLQPSWELSVTYPMVFKEGSTFYMIWDGHGYHESKGLSTSPDLINWTPYANNPIMGFDAANVDRGGNGEFAWGDIIKVGSTYHMFPSKGPGVTVHAQSTNLTTWTGYETLITNDPAGIGSGAAILKEGDGITPVVSDGKYWMVYHHGSTSGPMYLAYSTDLINWTRSPSTAILTGGVGQWDQKIYTPTFIKIGSTYYIYYQGADVSNVWKIGFASAPATNPPDQVTFTKYAGNPLISGNNGWEINNAAIDPVFRFFDGTYYLFYTGGQDNGFATSSTPEGPWTQTTGWTKNLAGQIPQAPAGVIQLAETQFIQTTTSYSSGNAVGYRASFNYVIPNSYDDYKWGGFIDLYLSPFMHIRHDDSRTYMQFMTISEQDTVGNYYNSFHKYEITWSSSLGRAYVNDTLRASITSGVPTVSLPIDFYNLNDESATLDVDWMYLRQFSNPDPTVPTVGSEETRPLNVALKVFLQGPYSGASTMTTLLNSNLLIPLNSNTAYSTAVYGYTASTVVSIPNSTIVDWVLVELRTGTASGTKVGTRAAFLKSDGTIVDIDGISPVQFTGLSDGNYYIVVRHRNHLAIMSANAVVLSVSSSLYDFTTAQAQAFGTNPMGALSGGGFGMYSGDTDGSGTVNATDRSNAWNQRNLSGYYGTDVDLSGTVNAADRSTAWNNRNINSQTP